MSSKFNAQVHANVVKLGGVIDEDNQLAELVEKVPRGTIYIDLGDVERINSCGVRDWVNWLGRLETNGSSGVLVECSPAIVAQINLVNNFTGNGVVKSFYVPYFCPECDEEKVLLVEAADMGPPPHEPPTCRCDECDLVMDFDDMPDSYFAFLGHQKKVAPEPGAAASARGTPGKVRSRGSTPAVIADLAVNGATGASGVMARASVPSLPPTPRAATNSGRHRSLTGPGTSGVRRGSAYEGAGATAQAQVGTAATADTNAFGARMLASKGNGMVYAAIAVIAVIAAVVVALAAR
jgi:anti-anti-sigma regulatory factor